MTRFLALAFVLTAAAAFAQDATLTKVQGPVFVRAGGSTKDLLAKGGETLLYGDAVKTGPGGAAHVLLGDRGAVLLRENSFFTLQGTPTNTVLRFKLGEFLIGLRRKLETGETFKVRTPAAVAAVRGTLFWGKTDEKKTSTYAGLGHTIAVTAKGKTVLVHAGEKTTIPFGEAPAEVVPSMIPVSYTNNFWIGDTMQGLETLVDMPKAAAPAPAAAPAAAPSLKTAPAPTASPATPSDAPEDPDDPVTK